MACLAFLSAMGVSSSAVMAVRSKALFIGLGEVQNFNRKFTEGYGWAAYVSVVVLR